MLWRRHAAVIVLFAAAILLVASPVLAFHFHSSGEWTMGLWDGDDTDQHLRPQTLTIPGHSHQIHTLLYKASTAVAGAMCGSCMVVAFDWDTAPYQECAYKSEHWGYTHPLNRHFHYHHNWCM